MNKALILAAVGFLIVLSGCSRSSDGPLSVGPGVDGPLILSFPRDGGEDALISGMVGIEADGCVTVAGNVAVWPPGTTWDEASESIVLPDGSIVVGGDSIEGNGGYRPPSNLEFFVNDEGAEAVLSCVVDRSSEIAVFNSPADSVGLMQQ